MTMCISVKELIQIPSRENECRLVARGPRRRQWGWRSRGTQVIKEMMGTV